MAAVAEYSVQKEYEKLPNIKPEDVQNLRRWLKEQPHLPHDYITELDIILAYSSCDCNTEQTKHVIDLNFTLRTLFSFYSCREIDKSLEIAFRTWLMIPLQTATNKGYKAIYCQLLNADPTMFNYSDVVRAFVMVLDLWLYEEGTLPGIVFIVNMDAVSMGHLSRINLTVAQQFFYFLQEAMFVRLKEFHFINAPSFIDGLLSMVSPFMKKDMLELLKIHQVGSNTLKDYIPVAALPKDAGGENKDKITLKEEIWNKIKANKKFFEEESCKRVDESKRPGSPKAMSTFFPGLEGTFKKLEID